MKVLWFSNNPANGISYLKHSLRGTGGWMSSLDKEIQKQVDLHVAFYYPYNKEKFKYLSTTYYPIFRGGILKEHLHKRFFSKEIKGKDLALYIRIIKEVNPDIIHIHGSENPFISLIGEIDIPIVVSIQGNMTVYYHKFCSGIESKFLKYKSQKKQNLFLDILLGNISWRSIYKSFYKRSLYERTKMIDCKNILGRTDWDRRISRILSPQSSYFHVGEVLRESFYQNKWNSLNRNKKIIIHTTNGNSFYKGFETLCYALKLLQNLGLKVEWNVAGVSPNDSIVKIVKKKLGKNYPLFNLNLLGNLDESKLLAALLKSDIYVMPSHIENSPNNLCEAMILGMPCIATYVGGTSSLLKDKKEGLLIQDGDPWVMAGAILELKNNWTQTLEYAKNARLVALERHNPSRIVQELIASYKYVCKIDLE